MTYRGHIENGMVVLDDPVSLPDGAEVRCVVVSVRPRDEDKAGTTGGLYGDLMEFAGKASGFPEDASENLDHYLYGHVKK